MANAYAENPKTKVVIIVGSVGRGTADAYSDIEIDVYYAFPPTVEERKAAVERCGATLEGLPEDDHEWEEQMSFSGFETATSTFLVTTMERFLHQVVELGDSDEDDQMRLFSVHSTPVHGQNISDQWTKTANAYPDELVRATLNQNMRFYNFFRNARMHVEREDLLAFYDLVTDCEKRLLKMHLSEVVDEMRKKPSHFADRLKSVHRSDPVEGLVTLEGLVSEVLDCIEENFLSYEIDNGSRGKGERRSVWDDPPE